MTTLDDDESPGPPKKACLVSDASCHPIYQQLHGKPRAGSSHDGVCFGTSSAHSSRGSHILCTVNGDSEESMRFGDRGLLSTLRGVANVLITVAGRMLREMTKTDPDAGVFRRED